MGDANRHPLSFWHNSLGEFRIVFKESDRTNLQMKLKEKAK